MESILIETKRLYIRPTNLKDGSFILELLNSPKWKQFIGDRNIFTIKDAENYIQTKMLTHLKQYGYANNTVLLKSDFTKIGSCGIYNRDNIPGKDIGFAFLPQFENKGYAFEATNALKNIAYDLFHIPVLNAYTTKDNFASQKLLEKLNFSLKGKMQFPNEEIELLHYSLNLST